MQNIASKSRCIAAVALTAVTVAAMAQTTTEVVTLTPTTVKIINTAPGKASTASRASVIDNKRVEPSNTTIKAKTVGDVTEVYAPDGHLLLKVLAPQTDATGKSVTRIVPAAKASLYGTGERGHKLNLEGDTLTMYNRQNYGYTGQDSRINQMNITMPLFLSGAGYAVVMDDFHPGQLIMGDTIKYVSENPSPVSLYVVASANGSLASLTEGLSELTGRQEMPPLWSMGYITSKYGYKTQQETEDVIDRLRAEGYPVDGIVLDLYWYGKEQDMGRLAWDPQQWPDAKGMLEYLKGKGVHLVAISQPYVLRNGRGIDNYNELAPKGYFMADSTGTQPQNVTIWVGEGGMFDVSNPGTRQWLADRYDQLTQTGIGGWWGDLGEPEVHPQTGIHANGLTARQYHNQYGNDWSEIIYDLFKEKYPDTRLMTMMRGGTTGLQRYDVFPWSTDVSRSWGGLEPQVVIMTQSGLSGLGYMGHDVGGFAVDPANPVDPELYVRWLQLGTFSPILRTHAQEAAEPYLYPEQRDIILPLIRERYRWLPYNYTLAHENATKGYPLVRPLEFASTAPTGKYDNIRDEYMWGGEVLVAPVMTAGATERKVVFPSTSPLWIDIANPELTYEGGTEATVAAPLDKLPLYARAGAFIPTAEYKMTGTRDYRTDRYTVNYYPVQGVSSAYTLFEDDRTTPTAKNGGAGLAMTFSGSYEGKDIAVVMTSEGTYPGVNTAKNINLVINGVKSEPKKVEVNNINTRFTYDKASGKVTVSLMWRTDSQLNLLMKLK